MGAGKKEGGARGRKDTAIGHGGMQIECGMSGLPWGASWSTTFPREEVLGVEDRCLVSRLLIAMFCEGGGGMCYSAGVVLSELWSEWILAAGLVLYADGESRRSAGTLRSAIPSQRFSLQQTLTRGTPRAIGPRQKRRWIQD